ncbi:hypothetical protein AB9F35_34770, partial [Rhizobium leguminosarum]
LRTILLLTLAVAGAHFKVAAAFAQEPQAPSAAQAPLADSPLDQATKEIDKAKVQLTARLSSSALVASSTRASSLSAFCLTPS